MKKFIARALVFILPLLLLLLPSIYILFSYGENFKNIDKYVKGNKYLIGYLYNEENYGYLKWKTLVSKDKCDVVALGSSRVLQLRDKMFTSSFYNAGYTITSMTDFIPFLKTIPKEKYPKYLIISLDQWMFNKACDKLDNVSSGEKWKQGFRFYPDFPTIKDLSGKIFQNKYDWAPETNMDDIKLVGFNAVMNHTGFRDDGSMFYGDQINKLLRDDPSLRDHRFADTYSRIENGNRCFEYGENVNPAAIKELDGILKFCNDNGIYVVAFLPPFAEAVYQKMITSGKYNYLSQLYPAALGVFKKYRFELYDFSSVKMCDSNDSETIDGFHGGEVTYIKMLMKMLRSGSALNGVCSLEKLRKDSSAPVNRYLVYSY